MVWTSGVRRTMLTLVLLVGVGAPQDGRAQNNRYTERSFVASPVALGMGDAGVALSGPDHVFFYNPAHLSRTASYFTVFGLQGAATPSLIDHIRFLNQEASSAVDANFDLSPDARAEFRRSAAALRRRPSRGSGDILLPSFVYSPGALGIGGGLFTKTAVNYRLPNGVDGSPAVWLLSRTDLMALLSVGLDLRVFGLPGVSIGATGTQTRRFLAFKNKSLNRFDADERAVQLSGGTLQLDVGLTYTPGWTDPLPGTLRFGGTVYDVLRQGYDYRAGGAGRLPFLQSIVDTPTDSLGPDPGEVRRAREHFSLEPSYRAGVAYQLPTLLFLRDVGIALDYQGYGEGPHPLAARLHLGARATVVGSLEVRAGLSSGYPSGGLGVEWGALHLDYSLHGVEEGRRAGQFHSYVHTARLLVRLE